MINASCTCGWTIAGPPEDSWTIDEAVAEHDIWCGDNQDWVDEEIEGQQIERDRIIGRIRQTFSPAHADFIVAAITSTAKSDHGTPAKKFPVIAPNPNPHEEERAMSDATESTAWDPIWCVDCFIINDEERHHRGAPITYTRASSLRWGEIDLMARLQLWECSDQEMTQPPTVEVTLNDGETADLTLHDLDQVINVLTQARRQLIEVGED